MVEFFQIAGVAALGVLLALADVAALAGQLRVFVALLGRIGQLEERLHIGVQLLGLLVVETVIFQGDKANILIGLTELLHEAGLAPGVAGTEVGEVERGNLVKKLVLHGKNRFTLRPVAAFGGQRCKLSKTPHRGQAVSVLAYRYDKHNNYCQPF